MKTPLQLVAPAKIRGVLLGPGAGVTERTHHFTLTALQAQKPVVLDADVFSIFADKPSTLFEAIRSPCILTPHEGEFARLFPDIDLKSDREAAARAAAKRAQAIVVLKGPQTVIAASDGRLSVNPPASPFLATAGTGDVLAGFLPWFIGAGDGGI